MGSRSRLEEMISRRLPALGWAHSKPAGTGGHRGSHYTESAAATGTPCLASPLCSCPEFLNMRSPVRASGLGMGLCPQVEDGEVSPRVWTGLQKRRARRVRMAGGNRGAWRQARASPGAGNQRLVGILHHMFGFWGEGLRNSQAGTISLPSPLSPLCLLSSLHTEAQMILSHPTWLVMYPLLATFTRSPTGSRANSPAGGVCSCGGLYVAGCIWVWRW